MGELCTSSSTNSHPHSLLPCSKRRSRRGISSLVSLLSFFLFLLFLFLPFLITHSSGLDMPGQEELVDPQTDNYKREKGGVHSGFLKKCKNKVEIPTIKVQEFMMRISTNHGNRRKPGSYVYHEVPSGPNPISNSMPGTK